MKAVKVQYKVNLDYVNQNKANIKKVMDRLMSEPISGMLYSSYVLDDGQTFVHINVSRDEITMNKLNEVAEFGEFRKALKASNPINPPQATNLNFVGAGFEL